MKRTVLHAALAAGCMLLLSGCGSDGEDGSPDAGSAAGQDGPPPEAAGENWVDPAGVTFARELDVRLDAMTRYSDGLYIQTVREGEGEGAAPGDTLGIRYVLWLPDGTRVDDNQNQPEPMEIVFGESTLIPAWNRGLYGMTPGEERRLVVPPHLAHGRAGLGEAIPPDAVVIFDLTRVDRVDGVDAVDSAGASEAPGG